MKTNRFDVREFARGNIMGYQTLAHLSVDDIFDLGKFSLMYDEPTVALEWLEEALLQVQHLEDSAVNIY